MKCEMKNVAFISGISTRLTVSLRFHNLAIRHKRIQTNSVQFIIFYTGAEVRVTLWPDVSSFQACLSCSRCSMLLSGWQSTVLSRTSITSRFHLFLSDTSTIFFSLDNQRSFRWSPWTQDIFSPRLSRIWDPTSGHISERFITLPAKVVLNAQSELIESKGSDYIYITVMQLQITCLY